MLFRSVLEAFKETRNAIVNFNKIKEVYELRANLERSAKSYMDQMCIRDRGSSEVTSFRREASFIVCIILHLGKIT